MTAQSGSTFDPVLSDRRSSRYDAEFYTFNYVYQYNNVIFDILLSPDAPPGYDTANPIERRYLQTLESAGQCDGDNEEDIRRMCEEANRTEAEVEKDLLEVCKSTMQALAPRTEALGEKPSLDSWMYPKTINLQLVTKQGILTVVKRDDDLPIHDSHVYITDPQVLAFNLPHHKISEIQVITRLYPYVYKVNVKGQTMVAKLGRSEAHDSITDEIKKLYGIQASAQGPLARVPQLQGFVSSPMGIVGFLIDYIPSLCHNLEYALAYARVTGGAVPQNKDAPSPPAITISKARKEKWTRQIQETLQSLHARNVVWGDAKLANVLIDEVTDDAWMIDFGGGNTQGWIERDLHGSKAGDLQALDRITAELAAV
ncbi:hypothetical protein BDZ45DRAFT_689401 [Acephala macrosclerotiorum]|nr:hypothetical protein BDZ45DRAFT_689401 [Acephala macrosclerotiorum]